jgi:hypothetical protein
MFGFFPPEIWNMLEIAWRYVYLSMPFWLPLVIGWTLFQTWLKYRRWQFWSKQEPILLELRLPKDIFKSPVAMELVLDAVWQTGGEGTWYDRLWKGQTRPWFSLELVSIGGRISFYIWGWKQYRNIIENQIYSQFPGVEIYEVTDYTLPVVYDPEKVNLRPFEFILSGPDPLPIKTYTDYGLEQTLVKEEQKVDPMTSMLEFLGSITEGHEIWMQVIVRAHKPEQRKPGTWFGKTDAWKDEAAEQVKKILADAKKLAGEDGKGGSPTKAQQDKIYAIQRSITKRPFDCGIRVLYVADKDKYDSGNHAGISGMLKQFGSPDLNGFKPAGWLSIFDYPWQDYYGLGRKKEWLKKTGLEEYKMRSFFFSQHQGKRFMSKPFVLNSEELATIYHFPGAVATTPTLDRVPSRKVEAPSNLPI